MTDERQPSKSVPPRRPGARPWERPVQPGNRANGAPVRGAVAKTPAAPKPAPAQAPAAKASAAAPSSRLGSPSPRITATPRRSRRPLIIGGAITAAIVVLGATGWAVSSSFSGESSDGNDSFMEGMAPLMSTTSAVATTPASPTPAAPAACAEKTENGVVTSAGPGGNTSGPGVIEAFQYGFYVLRDAVKAREVVAPDARVTPVADIQAGINATPVGTTHCLTITPRENGVYAVALTQTEPGGTPVTWYQLVTTAPAGDRTTITAITADTEMTR